MSDLTQSFCSLDAVYAQEQEQEPCPDYCPIINKACDAGTHCPEGCVIEQERTKRIEALNKVYKGFAEPTDVALENFKIDYPDYNVSSTIDDQRQAFRVRVSKEVPGRGICYVEHLIAFEYLTMLRVPMNLYDDLKHLKHRLDKEAR